MKNTSPRRVLVTGSSRGIGRAIALAAAKLNFHITIHARTSATEANEVAQQIQASGGSANVLLFDITDRPATRAALAQEIENHGAYYGIVCNAGITRDGAFPGLTDEDWDDVIDAGLNGFFNIVQPLTMPMIRLKQGGRIVTLASVSGVMGNRGQVNYSAAKSGIIGATKALAMELASRKITVNCVAPGLIETDMTKGLPLEDALKGVPMGRMGQPEEVASLVAFLLSDQASYITRQIIGINGGMI
jgi:3-oxoacyl-[acyl-carrier protein] reductase